jgi:hypothetical protein
VRYRQIGTGEIADFGFQQVGMPRVVRQYQHRLLQRAGEFCRSQRCAGADETADRGDLARSISESRIDE